MSRSRLRIPETPHWLVPDLRAAGPEEVVAYGGRLTVETLRHAYRMGVFPWPVEGYPLLWFCPPQRAILDFSELHIPKSLGRARRRSEFTLTFDCAFEDVITACRAMPRPGQAGTWITPSLIAAYLDLHQAGDAHSVEVWDSEGALVGGLYGVSVGGMYAGESMFHRAPNASKLALLCLIEHLRQRGLTWIDIQMLTPHLAALGARTIPRRDFLDRLAETQARGLALFSSLHG